MESNIEILDDEHTIVYLQPLINAKVYAPMFDKTFDLLTPQEQKAQLDFWVEHQEQGKKAPYDLTVEKPTQKQRKEDFNKFVKGKKK